MKKTILFSLVLAVALFFFACNPNDPIPDPNPVTPDTEYARTVLFEEFTGASCVYCPGGAASMKAAAHDSIHRVAIIAHHVGYEEDNYTIAQSRVFGSFFSVSGAPNMMIDRKKVASFTSIVFHPGYLTKNIVKKRLDEPAFVKVDIDLTYNDATKNLSVTVSGEFSKDYPNARLNLFLVQDSIIGPQIGINDAGSAAITIPDYAHMFVPRARISGDNWGDEIANNIGTYSKTYDYTIPESIKGVKNVSVTCVPKNMYVVAFVANYDSSNKNDCEVLNAAFKSVMP